MPPVNAGLFGFRDGNSAVSPQNELLEPRGRHLRETLRLVDAPLFDGEVWVLIAKGPGYRRLL